MEKIVSGGTWIPPIRNRSGVINPSIDCPTLSVHSATVRQGEQLDLEFKAMGIGICEMQKLFSGASDNPVFFRHFLRILLELFSSFVETRSSWQIPLKLCVDVQGTK